MGQLPAHAYNSGSAMVPTTHRVTHGQHPGSYAGHGGCYPDYCDPCYDQVQGAVLPPRGGYHGDKAIAGRRRAAIDAIRHGRGKGCPVGTHPCNAPSGCCPNIQVPTPPPPAQPGVGTWGRKARYGYGYGWAGRRAVDNVRHGSRYMGARVWSGSRYMGARKADKIRHGYAGGHHQGHHHHDHDHGGACCDSCAQGGPCVGCDGNCGADCTCK